MFAVDGITVKDWQVCHGATSSTDRLVGDQGQDETAAFTSYVDREFPRLTDQKPECYSVPSKFLRWGDSDNEMGEYAELTVFLRLKEYAKTIPGLGMVFFHGRSYAGRKDLDTDKLLCRELDFGVFVSFGGMKKIMFIEVKGCDISFPNKKLNENRKKANNQLQAHLDK